MPLYEYECEACSRRFERIQKFSDPPIETCPHCSAGPVRKLLSTPAIQFKGSGWYITDYARKGRDGSKPGAGDSKPGDAKAESKPESKSETKTDSSSKSSTAES